MKYFRSSLDLHYCQLSFTLLCTSLLLFFKEILIKYKSASCHLKIITGPWMNKSRIKSPTPLSVWILSTICKNVFIIPQTLCWKSAIGWSLFYMHDVSGIFSNPILWLVINIRRVGTLIVANIYLQLIQNIYMFRSFTVFHCSHQHCVQPVASDVEVVGYL